MQLTFLVGQDGRNVKRHHSSQACNMCRRRKKRCFHTKKDLLEQSIQAETSSSRQALGNARVGSATAEVNSTGPKSPVVLDTSARLGISQDREATGWRDQSHNVRETLHAEEQPSSSESGVRRFACDSNPVVTFFDNPESRLQKGQTPRGDVGGWYDDRISPEYRCSSLPLANYPSQDSILLPPRACQEALVKIFFRRIHPILPLLDEEDTVGRFKNHTIYPPLLQSICLVASKDHSALPFLCLGSNEALLPLETFSQRLYQDALKNVPSRQAGKRITIIQVLALLSLHEWGPSGSEDSSLNLVQAIHHAQTIGLHLRRPEKESGLQLKALFWTLWSLDRWNSAIHGRPIMIHDRDLGQSATDAISSFEPPFRVWLHLANNLNQVIDSYRPAVHDNSEKQPEIPSFEEVVDMSNSWDTSPEILSSLEFFHHAIILLSTHSNELQGRLHSRESTIRQSQSILTIATLCRRSRVEDLLPISISAYVLSLALSITYRQRKKTQLATAKLLANENLTIFYQCLVSLSGTWWLAAMMMRLGKHALENTQGLRNAPPAQRIISSQEELDATSAVDSAAPANPCRAPHVSDANLETSREIQDTPIVSSSYSPPEGVFSSDLDHLFENFDFASVEEGYFDTFFQNFLDVNLPTTLEEQILGDQGNSL